MQLQTMEPAQFQKRNYLNNQSPDGRLNSLNKINQTVRKHSSVRRNTNQNYQTMATNSKAKGTKQVFKNAIRIEGGGSGGQSEFQDNFSNDMDLMANLQFQA